MGTKKQNMMIGYLISRLRIDQETKEDMIYYHTDGRTTHISQMTEREATHLIGVLVKDSALPESPDVRMRRKILSMAHELFWELPDGRVNMAKVNNWCIQYSGQNKPLDQLKGFGLVTAVTAFESYYSQYLKGI